MTRRNNMRNYVEIDDVQFVEIQIELNMKNTRRGRGGGQNFGELFWLLRINAYNFLRDWQL